MKTQYAQLLGEGLLNAEAPSYAEIQETKEKYEVVAKCYSDHCQVKGISGLKSIRKDTCPDCGHYLVFSNRAIR